MTVASGWSDALTAIRLFAVDPIGTGGILLRSRAGPVRDRWLSMLRETLGSTLALKHLPLHIADSRLLGGLDLNATLLAGRPVAERGLLAEADGGVLLLAMAERLSPATTAHVTAAMDTHEIRVERDGLSLRLPTRFGVVALDEGLDDEFAPPALRDRLAFHIDINDISLGIADLFALDDDTLGAARQRLASLPVATAQVDALCTAAAALGIVSLRTPLQALRVAYASAALAGHDTVEQDDVALAARLVLAPRALVFPDLEEPSEQAEPPPEGETNTVDDDPPGEIDRALDDVTLAAVQAAIPPDVLAALRAGAMARSRSRSAGKAGALQKSGDRGRPVGVTRGTLAAGARLNVIETLRAAAPWQALRRRDMAADGTSRPLIHIRKDDFRLSRFKQRSQTTTIFVVDASGSAALHRLAEAKGAVELLLADCYVRRDQVALIAFRGVGAELLLPPTRSLARAKRSLAGLPGGGGTPLAAGLDAAYALADLIKRKGQTPTVILLTDGRPNIARDGAPGRPRAEQDAVSAARQLRAAGMSSVLVDTSPRPGPQAAQFAKEMGARYLPLPHADAAVLSKAVLASIG
ncbi:MAG: magnesium chelatase subunit D [Bradyrhizobiaceae bacterium]|nr:MAG: magnesium chelatase subunit D [Bradyrhizobiaceae bacterium]